MILYNILMLGPFQALCSLDKRQTLSAWQRRVV